MTEFKGTIGRTVDDSKPWWPQPTRAPAGVPDIVYLILDDVGFGWLGCYGGPIDTKLQQMDYYITTGIQLLYVLPLEHAFLRDVIIIQ